MKLRLPSSYLDLKLKHLQVLETTEDPVKRVQAVTGLSFAELRKMPQALLVEAERHIEYLLKQEQSVHLKTFKLQGTEYGFIPDWEEFSAGEWIDLETYTADFWPTAHKAMSILYRPVTRKAGDTYTIEPYTAKEDATPFLDMPAPLVAGALLFFWTTEHKLLNDLRSSLIRTTKEATSLVANGVGIPSSTHWLTSTFLKWRQSRRFRSGTLLPISPSLKTSATSERKNRNNG